MLSGFKSRSIHQFDKAIRTWYNIGEMKQVKISLVYLMVGALTAMCGFPIYAAGVFSIKNLLILILSLGIVRLMTDME